MAAVTLEVMERVAKKPLERIRMFKQMHLSIKLLRSLRQGLNLAAINQTG